MISTSLSVDADTVGYEFDFLIAAVAKVANEKRDRVELGIMNG